MTEYTIELLNRPFYGQWGTGYTTCEVAQFADNAEAIHRAKEIYKAHESRAIGWKVSNSCGKLVGIGLLGA